MGNIARRICSYHSTFGTMRQYTAIPQPDELKVVYAKIMDTSKGNVGYTNVYGYRAGTT